MRPKTILAQKLRAGVHMRIDGILHTMDKMLSRELRVVTLEGYPTSRSHGDDRIQRTFKFTERVEIWV